MFNNSFSNGSDNPLESEFLIMKLDISYFRAEFLRCN